MWRYFTHMRSKGYIDVLQKFANAYKHACHSGTRMPPTNVILENARVVRENLARQHAANTRKNKNPPKYSVGELARINKSKAAFAKAYKRGWSKELFKIQRISRHREPFVYILRDLENEDIDGIF